MRSNSKQLAIAKTVQNACIRVAKEGFYNASMSGLCTEGAIESAIGAMQSLDLEAIVGKAIQDEQ
ncbi:MAG: acetyltransferase [Balneolaceae bacterium]|nr:acetyltransferase [Balneolaceae bacterium]